MARARLITIPLSHYCEKARWALDYTGVEYTEDGHMPGLHKWATRVAGAGGTVPVLVHEGRVLGDSTLILQHLDERAPPERRLYPADPAKRREVLELEELFDEKLGPAVRRVAYFHLMPAQDTLLRLMSAGVPPRQVSLFKASYPVLTGLMRRAMKIDAAGAERSRASAERVFERVASRLADGRRYLCGDTFTAADLTFAALASLMAMPANHPLPLRREELPAPLVAEIDARKDHPALRYALRLYADHRRC